MIGLELTLVERIDRGLGVKGLIEDEPEAGCLGITRFYDCGEEQPDRVMTCHWLGASVSVLCVRGWSQVPAIEQRGQFKSRSWSVRIPLLLLPNALRGWRRILQTLRRTPSCDPPTDRMNFGGTLCYHSVLDVGKFATVTWLQPDPVVNRNQIAMIHSYRWLWVTAWLLSWLPFWPGVFSATRGPG